MGNNAGIAEDNYERIFQRALSNTLQLTTCRFYAHIVWEDGRSTDITEMWGDYVAGRGVFKHEKATYYEADWLLLKDGSYFRYKGQDWRDLGQILISQDLSRIPGLDVDRVYPTLPGEPNHKIPVLAHIPVFDDLAKMGTRFTTVGLQTIDNKTFYQFVFRDSADNESTLSRIFYVSIDAPEYIMRIEEADYLEISDDASFVTVEFWPTTSANDYTQPPTLKMVL